MIDAETFKAHVQAVTASALAAPGADRPVPFTAGLLAALLGISAKAANLTIEGLIPHLERAGTSGSGTELDEALIDALAQVITSTVEARLKKEISDRRLMSFRGPHDPGTRYEAGEVVQRSGVAWVCLKASGDAPGQSPDWRALQALR